MDDFRLSSSVEVSSIQELNALPHNLKHSIYEQLLPGWILEHIGLSSTDGLSHLHGHVELDCPPGSRAVEIAVWRTRGDQDPIVYLHMMDTLNLQILVLLLVVNDLDAPRFNIDVDRDGHLTNLGTTSRNIAAEILAMQAGLAPGQIRRGLRAFRQMAPVFEEFVRKLGHDMFFIEPLAYHNAIVFERYGFNYLSGHDKMEQINEAFQPGGDLYRRLDGSTPFRMPGAWKSIRGRSWAIHDGVLGHPFSDCRMYKHLGKDAGINTFPESRW